jgi:hypothetical protein
MRESQASVFTISQAVEDYGTSCAHVNNAKHVSFGVSRCLMCSYDNFQEL